MTDQTNDPPTTRTALVTGASRGIGRAIACRLADLGYNLFLLARNEESLAEVVAECRSRNVEAASLAGELTDESYVEQALQSAHARFGPAVDVLVNNAGAARREAVQDADMEAWRALMDLNFGAVVQLSRRLLPGMIARRAGAIINISSISGRHTSAESAIYCASKHALNGFSGCLYEDVRDYGIKVSTIMPGFVSTALTHDLGLTAGHMIQPGDVADSVEYVLATSSHCCPTEIVLRPQLRP